MARCPGCFAPLTAQGCLCSGSERRLAERARELMMATAGATCEWHPGDERLCGAPAVKVIADAGHRYGVCRQHLKKWEVGALAHEPERMEPPSRFGPCPACQTNITMLPCTHCGFAGGATGYAAVPQRSRTVLRGIDALGILLQMSPDGPDDY